MQTTKDLVFFKGLPPVCMKYTARGESRVANIAGGPSAIFVTRLSPSIVYFHTNEVAVC